MKPSNIPRCIKRDVDRVRRLARVVIEIDKRGACTVRRQSASEHRLSTIAVVGPGDFLEQHYDHALLCEVGVGRGRPYAFAFIRGKHVAKRRKWFWLTDEQYLAVAPFIFAEIDRLMKERVASRTSGTPENPMILPTFVSYFDKRERMNTTRKVNVSVVNGSRFSVAYADRRLLSDVLWAEWNLNKEAKSRICRLARWIGWNLNHYHINSRTIGKGFWKLGRVKQVLVALSRKELLPHEKIRLVNELSLSSNRGGRRFLNRFQELFGEPNRFFPELENEALPRVRERTGSILVRTVRAKLRYMTIEVFPDGISTSCFRRKKRKLAKP